MFVRPTAPLVLVALAVACAPEDQLTAPIDTASEDLWRTKDNGGANGFYDYCDGATLCVQGEGDCDLDAQCDGGLECVSDLGDNFGFAFTTDVCAPAHCEDGVTSGDETYVDFGGSCGAVCAGNNLEPEFCRPGCECAEGEGDCDLDEDCQAGLECGIDEGAAYGLYWSTDVCVPAQCNNGIQDGTETAVDFGGECAAGCGGANGDQEGYCTPGCPCAHGEGDCDDDSECEPGLMCAVDMGDWFGLLATDDVCMHTLSVAELSAGDLVISEIMVNPVQKADSGAEWFELHNTLTVDIDLNGLYVQDSLDIQKITVATSVILPGQSYAVFARSNNALLNGLTAGEVDYDYVNTFALSDTLDQIILKTASGGTTLDTVSYNTSAGWTVPAGATLELGSQHLLDDTNHLATSWCASTGSGVASGDKGTPGYVNRVCP